jgi:hypothetical protein
MALGDILCWRDYGRFDIKAADVWPQATGKIARESDRIITLGAGFIRRWQPF